MKVVDAILTGLAGAAVVTAADVIGRRIRNERHETFCESVCHAVGNTTNVIIGGATIAGVTVLGSTVYLYVLQEKA